MKKRAWFILLLLLVLSPFFVTAANQTAIDAKAYECLESKVDGKCSTISPEEKIFSLLAIGKCKTELLAEESSEGCWPEDDCKIKTTAQAVLALRKAGDKTIESENWLSSNSITSPNVDWFLQVETSEESSCTVSYSGSSYIFSLDENKELSRNAGTCLNVYRDYWFKVSPSCYGVDFKISCDKSFLTSLLYKKKNSQTLYDFYVSDKTSSASGDGSTTEKVNSLCFSRGTSCDYEGTLWAAVVLKYLGKDVSAYLPYLITMAEDNSKYLPESFLYTLTNNFKVILLTKQKENKYWSESGDKFYDTAVALFPFQNDETLAEKTNSKNWLKDLQGNNGCWQDNIRNTAFILYSLWAKKISVSSDSSDCESSNYFCMSSASCTSVEGKVLNGYSGCLGTSICCDKEKELDLCYKQGGELCSSNEKCLGGHEIESSDSTSGKICCAGGSCGIQEESECELNQGTCKTSCSSNERATSNDCPSSDICCVSKPAGSPVFLIVLLIILITLTALGIIFRKKLRDFLIRFKSRFGKGKSSNVKGGPRFPPTSSSKIPLGAVQRRILPNQSQPVMRRPMQTKTEFDDVLKKLKEIGN